MWNYNIEIKFNKRKAVLLLIICIIAYWFLPVPVFVTKLNSSYCPDVKTGWFEEEYVYKQNIKPLGVKLPDVNIDFNRYDLVVSTGRPLILMLYMRISKFIIDEYGKDIYIAYPIYGNSLGKENLFIYRIDKIRIVDDNYDPRYSDYF